MAITKDEPGMKTQYEHVGAPIRIGEFTVTPVTETNLDIVNWNRSIYVWGSIKPVAVLISTIGNEQRIEITPPDGDTPSP